MTRRRSRPAKTASEILDQIASATRAHEFEVIAREIDDAALHSREMTLAFSARLAALSIDLPEALASYAERIMNGGETMYEEKYKVLLLTASLALLDKMELDGAANSASRLYAAVRDHAAHDGMYADAAQRAYGGTLPPWWRPKKPPVLGRPSKSRA